MLFFLFVCLFVCFACLVSNGTRVFVQIVRDELYEYLERHNNSLQPYFNPDLVSAPACWRVIGA